MVLLKKLIFSVPFLIFLSLFFWQVNSFFKDFGLLFSLNLTTFYLLLTTTSFLLLASLCFIVFAALSNNWKFIIPVGLLASLIPLVIFPVNLGIIITVGLIASFLLTFVSLENKLKSYINFNANTLLNPSIKGLSTLIILATSVAFYLSVDSQIKQNGFKVPRAILDTALQFATPELPEVQGIQITQGPTLTPQQIELLRQNPDLVRQYGLDPSGLDSLPTTQSSTSPVSPQSPSNSLVENLLEQQLQQLIDPYLSLIAPILALLFFITLQSLSSLLSILLPILVSLTFLIFEKTEYIKFEKEMREVKKMVV